MKKISLVFTLILTAALSSCLSPPANYSPGFLSAKILKLVQKAVFEGACPVSLIKFHWYRKLKFLT